MIVLEFAQIVRVNHLAELFFVLAVIDDEALVVVPFDPSRQERVPVPFRTSAADTRTFAFRDIRQLEILQAPSPTSRGVCGYYALRPDALVDLFLACRWTMRVRVVAVEQDRMLFVLADTHTQAQLPPIERAAVYSLDFRYRGAHPDLGLVDLVPVASSSSDSDPVSVSVSADVVQEQEQPAHDIHRGLALWLEAQRREAKPSPSSSSSSSSGTDGWVCISPRAVARAGAAVWLFQYRLQPLWASRAAARSARTRALPGDDVAFLPDEWREVVNVSGCASAPERAVLGRTRFAQLRWLLDCQRVGTSSSSLKRAREPALAPPSSSSFSPPSGFALPLSLALLGAKVLACVFETRAAADEQATHAHSRPPCMQAELDDIDYAWTTQFRETCAQLGPLQREAFFAAALRAQRAPTRIPAELVPLLARCLAAGPGHRPVLGGYYARVQDASSSGSSSSSSSRRRHALLVWSEGSRQWLPPGHAVDDAHFHNLPQLGPAPAATTQVVEQQQHPPPQLAATTKKYHDDQGLELRTIFELAVAQWRASTLMFCRGALARMLVLRQTLECASSAPAPASASAPIDDFVTWRRGLQHSPAAHVVTEVHRACVRGPGPGGAGSWTHLASGRVFELELGLELGPLSKKDEEEVVEPARATLASPAAFMAIHGVHRSVLFAAWTRADAQPAWTRVLSAPNYRQAAEACARLCDPVDRYHAWQLWAFHACFAGPFREDLYPSVRACGLGLRHERAESAAEHETRETLMDALFRAAGDDPLGTDARAAIGSAPPPNVRFDYAHSRPALETVWLRLCLGCGGGGGGGGGGTRNQCVAAAAATDDAEAEAEKEAGQIAQAELLLSRVAAEILAGNPGRALRIPASEPTSFRAVAQLLADELAARQDDDEGARTLLRLSSSSPPAALPTFVLRSLCKLAPPPAQVQGWVAHRKERACALLSQVEGLPPALAAEAWTALWRASWLDGVAATWGK